MLSFEIEQKVCFDENIAARVKTCTSPLEPLFRCMSHGLIALLALFSFNIHEHYGYLKSVTVRQSLVYPQHIFWLKVI